MATDDEVRIKLSLLNATKFKSDADGAARSISRLGNAVRTTGRNATESNKELRAVAVSTRQVAQSTNLATTASDRLHNSMKRSTGVARTAAPTYTGMGSGLSAIGITGAAAAGALMSTGTALGVAAIAAAGFGMKAAGSMEQAEVGFTTMLGSAEKAKAYIKDLQDFAVRTPFDFQGLANNAKYLMAVGYEADQVIPTLNTLGDAASGLNTGQEGITSMARALGQMRSNGVMSLEEIGQLADANVNAYKYLTEASGKSVGEIRKAAEKGQIDGKQAADVILRGLQNDTRFKGAMEAQSKTFLGQLANTRERLSMGAAKAFRPITDEIAKGMPGAAEAAGKGMDVLGSKIADGMTKFKEFKASGGLTELSNELKGTGKALWDVMTTVVWPFVRDSGPTILKTVVTSFRIVRSIFEIISSLSPVISFALQGVGFLLKIIEVQLSAVSWVFDKIAKAASWIGGVFGGGDKKSAAAAPQGPGLPKGGAAANPGGFAPAVQVKTQMADGGIVRRPGMSWVGERGPELLSLPRNARVDPLPETEASLSAGGDTVIHLSISGADVLNAKRVGQIVVAQLKDELARR